MSYHLIKAGIVRLWPDANPPENYREEGYTRIGDGSAGGDKPIWVRVLKDGNAVAGNWKTQEKHFIRTTTTKPSPEYVRRMTARTAYVFRDERPGVREQHAAERNKALWDSAEPVAPRGTVSGYLKGRHIDGCGGNLDVVLREHKHLAYYHDGEVLGHYPAMLAAITDKDGNMRAILRTYLDELGGKARVPQPKKITQVSGPLRGCSVKLFKLRPVDGLLTIGIAEGIETALSCFVLNRMPTEAAVSAYGMGSYIWHPSLQSVIIYADHDKHRVGEKAAKTLATRATQAGLQSRILMPPLPGEDWADVLERRMDREQRL